LRRADPRSESTAAAAPAGGPNTAVMYVATLEQEAVVPVIGQRNGEADAVGLQLPKTPLADFDRVCATPAGHFPPNLTSSESHEAWSEAFVAHAAVLLFGICALRRL
jgi:hypothetical protein